MLAWVACAKPYAKGADLEMKPPTAKKIPHALTHHGDTRVDNYHWLRDDERDDPEVLTYLEQENNYSEQVLTPLNELQESLYQEMVARIRQDDSTVPYLKNGYWYQTRYQQGHEYSIIERYPDGHPEQVELLLDGNERARGQSYYGLGQLAVSPDQQTLAFAEDFVSRRQYQVRFKSLQTGELYPEVLENTSGNLEWANDGKTLFYVRQDEKTLLPYQVYRHTLGTPQSEDVLMYEEKDASFYTSIYKSRSDDYIVIGSWNTDSSELSLISANDPTAPARVFLPRARGHEYDLEHYQGRFYVRSNKDGANFGLYLADNGEPAQWQPLIPARDEVLLESFALFRDWLVLEERREGLVHLRQIHHRDGREHQIRLDDPAYVTWLGANPEDDSPWLRYGYSSMTRPVTTYEVNMDTQERRELKQQYVGERFNAEDYRSERLWVEARDGTRVPVSLVYRADKFKKDGSNPLLVYAYGSYGASMDPDFSSARLSLLDRGFVYAIAHVRGGEELGRDWYEQGRLLSKQNTFHDFIDVTRELVMQGYGDKERVFASGGSAGGLLVGSVINMEPELFKGVVAAVPFVDVVTTMLDESLPLTTGEYGEWGNPQEPEYYHYMKSYSPYDQVKPQAYPHMLVTTGLHDSQVQYWEPAKWVAKLREMKTDDNLLLLHCDMDSGHGGKSGRFEAYRELAREYAFLLALAEEEQGTSLAAFSDAAGAVH
ncbi:oligopeptidase B [Zobellella endophytica]|uniref:Oligopeptidase B n=1 Tax=Zobellella endophytica TaxID=2116700 RepID=A0A2P7R2L7_9GAMM|nr:S9 family peptidase [Zobellella endophytica]PSJ44455.1 oligopeptidase B [Zobellella endophytica]